MSLIKSLISKDTYARRRAEALSTAQARGFDGLVMWGRGGETGQAATDILFYANHFSPYPGQPPAQGLTSMEHAGLVIGPDGVGRLLTSGFVSEDAVVDETRSGADLNQVLVNTLRESGLTCGSIGVIGSETLPFLAVRAIADALPDVRLVPADDISSAQRMVVHPGDIPMLRHAAEVGTRIVDAITAAAQPGVTEGEAVAAGLAVAAQTPGCIHWAFMVASGPDASLFVRGGTPAWNPDYVYQVGDILHLDAYGFVFGYQYDLMRTVVVGGDATTEQTHVINASRDLIAGIAGLLKPGVTGQQLRAQAIELAEASGLEWRGNTTFGHGINFGWDRPWLQEPSDGPHNQIPLEPGSAYAFETFVHDNRGNYAKWEDMFLWTEAGVERLTPHAGD
jgi:Xaa-Pro aminopeptidase